MIEAAWDTDTERIKAEMVTSRYWLRPRHQSQRVVDDGGRGFPGSGGGMVYAGQRVKEGMEGERQEE